jgi:hypothetical protein
MKEVYIDGGVPSYNDSPVSTLGMGQGKHIRFTATDQAYIVEAFSEADGALSSDLPLSVPNDDTYHTLEIQGTKGNSYGLTITTDSGGETGGGTDSVKPTMIVKVD